MAVLTLTTVEKNTTEFIRYNINIKYAFITQSHKPVEQSEKLLHPAPVPDLRPGVGVLTELDQDPGDAPQQLQVLAVQQAQQHRQTFQLPHLVPHLPHRGQEPQQLRTHSGGNTGFSPALLGSMFLLCLLLIYHFKSYNLAAFKKCCGNEVSKRSHVQSTQKQQQYVCVLSDKTT